MHMLLLHSSSPTSSLIQTPSWLWLKQTGTNVPGSKAFQAVTGQVTFSGMKEKQRTLLFPKGAGTEVMQRAQAAP